MIYLGEAKTGVLLEIEAIKKTQTVGILAVNPQELHSKDTAERSIGLSTGSVYVHVHLE